jgi:hypothetical protein
LLSKENYEGRKFLSRLPQPLGEQHHDDANSQRLWYLASRNQAATMNQPSLYATTIVVDGLKVTQQFDILKQQKKIKKKI